MIKVHNYYFGEYHQKLIMDDKKIKGAECTCKWGQTNRKAWKEGNTICYHLKSAIDKREIEMKHEK